MTKENPHQIVFTAKSTIKQFPSEIKKPSEQIRYENLSDDEIKMCQYIRTEYKSNIETFTFWTEDIIPRFVTDTYYISKYDERLKLTTSRFEQYLDFHREYRFDDVLTAPCLNTEFKRRIIAEDICLLPFYFYGIDHEGHPILWWKATMLQNVKGINAAFGDHDNWERASFQLSRAQRMVTHLYSNINDHYGCKVNSCFAVIDLKGGSVSDFHSNWTFLKWYIKSLSELFPGALYKVFLINAPWTFQMIWKMICPFLDQSTVKKASILGKKYLKEMIKFIDLEMIPKEFGGNGIWNPRPGDVPIDFPFQMMGDQENDTKKKMLDDSNMTEDGFDPIGQVQLNNDNR